MSQELPGECQRIVDLQCGVIAHWQAKSAGMGPRVAENLVRSGRWRRLRFGVYAASAGEPSYQALRWAALLRAGPEAILSHRTAAEVDGLADGPARLFHLTVPLGQRLPPIAGVTIHRSGRIEGARTPIGVIPPRTLITETVLDLTQCADNFDEAFGWLARACQRDLTTPGMVRLRMDLRKKLRWRRELAEALGDVQAGVHSVLELRYRREVEQAHGLPHSRRQAKVVRGQRRQYRDVLYEEFGLCVELDGQAAHPPGTRWRDIDRDNRNAADGIQTLRFGWKDVVHACATAWMIGTVLRRRGWTGEIRRCGPRCSPAS